MLIIKCGNSKMWKARNGPPGLSCLGKSYLE